MCPGSSYELAWVPTHSDRILLLFNADTKASYSVSLWHFHLVSPGALIVFKYIAYMQVKHSQEAYKNLQQELVSYSSI
jgi:hypothetical protein